MVSDDVFHSSGTFKSRHGAMDISERISRQVCILLILCWVFQHTHEHSDEYCDTEVFRAECSEEEVILLERARYGRMKLGRCVELDMGHIGCFTDVLRLADRRCSGRRMCELRVPDAEFESTQPCLKELKTYLEASYICVKIESVSADHCRASEEINITSQSGYIASMSKSGDLCDAVNHPWVIAGQPGQKINLTIYDFASPSPSSPDEVEFGGQLPTYRDLRGPHTHPCRSYGTIYDSGLSGHSAICGTDSDSRVSNIYLSTGNSVKIFITDDLASDDVKRFLIKYSIVGCASPIVSEHAWFVKESDTRGAMGCLHTDVKWDIECLDGEWTSGSINCTLPVTEEAGHDVTVESLPKYYFDLIDRQHQSHYRPEKVSQDGGQFGGDRMDDVYLPDDQDRREYFEFAGLLATTVTASFIIIILVVLIVRVSKRRKNEREVSGVNSPETILLQNNSVPEVVEINYRIDDSISRIESSFKAQNNEQWRLLVNGKQNKTFQTTAVTKKCHV